MATKEISFEEKIKKLESIVAELESGEVPLDDAINIYSFGSDSLKFSHCFPVMFFSFHM